MLYTPIKVDIPEKVHEKLKLAIRRDNGAVSIKINLQNANGEQTLLLTRGQIGKIERARLIGKKSLSIRLSRRQVRMNLKHEGGFLGMLIAALAAALPSILSAAASAAPALIAGVATGALTGAIEKAISGNGFYLHKNGQCAKVQVVKGGGLYLSHHHHAEGDGLYLRHNHNIYGQGLIGSFKDEVPLLGLLL